MPGLSPRKCRGAKCEVTPLTRLVTWVCLMATLFLCDAPQPTPSTHSTPGLSCTLTATSPPHPNTPRPLMGDLPGCDPAGLGP